MRHVCQLSLRCPLFELRPQLICKVGSIFGPQAGPRKRVPVLLFKTVSQLGKSLGPKFGVQIWDPILGPKIWGPKFGPTLAMLFWLLVCARRACNSPNKYALPRGGRAGCGHDICLMDQSNRSNIFSTVFRDVNLAAATVGGPTRRSQKCLVFPTPEKWGRSFN